MSLLSIAIKGAAMGIAETIPGVSGGTIAFITGIYERLINAIKAFSPELVTHYKSSGLKGVWLRIDGRFLVSLLSGMVIGLGLGLYFISYLLETYPPVVWAFFFGLVIMSIIYLLSMIDKWNAKLVIWLVLGSLIAFMLTRLPIGQANENLLVVFIVGVIAISAMILPGISGSFLLLIMGMYQFILHDTLKTGVLENGDTTCIIRMVVFGLGCIVGLLSFSRVMSWAFKHHNQITLATLTGFILGSCYKLWPWRMPDSGYTEADKFVVYPTTEIIDKVVSEMYLSPSNYSSLTGLPNYLLYSIIAFIIGFIIVYLLWSNEN